MARPVKTRGGVGHGLTGHGLLAMLGVACAAVGVVLLAGFGGSAPDAALTAAEVLGSVLVGMAVMVLAAVALLRAGRR